MSRARCLRKNATDCERTLWRLLRNRNFAGYKFRRQPPIDPFVLDFYCPALKLAIELDGSGHDYAPRKRGDQRRSDFLAGNGVEVIRFWNHQVRRELDSVRQAIWFALSRRRLAQDSHLNPHPTLSLEKGEAVSRRSDETARR